MINLCEGAGRNRTNHFASDDLAAGMPVDSSSSAPLPDAAARILEAVQRAPGAAVADVARAVGVDHSTADYHLRRLLRDGFVGAVRSGRVRAHYAAGCGICPLVRAALPRLGGAHAAAPALAALVAAGNAGVRAADAARERGVPVGVMRYALQAAVGAGLAERVAFGRFALVPGASRCARCVTDRARCDAWRKCEPGARWRARAG